jgi:hypothetical protein
LKSCACEETNRDIDREIDRKQTERQTYRSPTFPVALLALDGAHEQLDGAGGEVLSRNGALARCLPGVKIIDLVWYRMTIKGGKWTLNDAAKLTKDDDDDDDDNNDCNSN